MAVVSCSDSRVPPELIFDQEKEEKQLPLADRSNLSLAVYANILHGVHTLKESTPVLKPLFEKKKISIIGGLYNMDNGKVSFVDEQ